MFDSNTTSYTKSIAAMLVFCSAGGMAEELVEKDKSRFHKARSKLMYQSSFPLKIYTKSDIKKSGFATLSEFLKNNVLNSFGSMTGQSGYIEDLPATDTIDYYGLNSTLVLINGRRMAGTDFSSGQEQNLNYIPLVSVERVEILPTGASALYGQNAEAAVVNIVTKSHFDGVEVSASLTERSVDNQGGRNIQFLGGFNDAATSLVVAAEFRREDPVSDSDIIGANSGRNAFSPVANATYFDSSESINHYWNADLCGVVSNTEAFPSADDCYYYYSNDSWLYPKKDTNSLSTTFEYQFSEDLEFYTDISVLQSDTDSKLSATPLELTMSSDNALLPQEISNNILAGSEVMIDHRTVALGNRLDKMEQKQWDIALGLNGRIASDKIFFLEYQHIQSQTKLADSNLINRDLFQIRLAQEQVDLFNVGGASTEVWTEQLQNFYQQVSHQAHFDADKKTDILSMRLQGDMSEFLQSKSSYRVGLEYSSDRVAKGFDALTVSGDIRGTAPLPGNSTIDAEQTLVSLFGDFSMQLDSGWNILLSARQSNIVIKNELASGDEESISNQSILTSLSYDITNNLSIKFVFNRSYALPELDELYRMSDQIYGSGFDSNQCSWELMPGYCFRNRHLFNFNGNEDLTAEESDNINLSLNWRVSQSFGLELAYFDYKVDNAISQPSFNTLLAIERALGASNSIVRNMEGEIEYVNFSFNNDSERHISGFNLSANYALSTDLGNWGVDIDVSQISEFKEKFAGSAVSNDLANEYGYPELRANLGVTWSSQPFDVALNSYYIKGQQSFWSKDDYLVHNIYASMEMPWSGRLNLSVTNLSDELPPSMESRSNSFYRAFNDTLYSPIGRIFSVGYTHSF